MFAFLPMSNPLLSFPCPSFSIWIHPKLNGRRQDCDIAFFVSAFLEDARTWAGWVGRLDNHGWDFGSRYACDMEHRINRIKYLVLNSCF